MDYAAARQHMIDSQIRTSKVTDQAVIAALAAVPRELFVDEAHRKLAYIDRSVPVGAGRRMMEPMVLARLLQAAQLRIGDSALVVAAGTGYAAAVLSHLVKRVIALDSTPELVQRARVALGGLPIGNVTVTEGDPAAGRPSDGPFDFILIDGAVEIVPDALTKQLADKGRLAVVMNDEGVSRGTLLLRADGVVSRRALFDADADLLPAFKRPQRFVF